jgi:hypothetical protein
MQVQERRDSRVPRIIAAVAAVVLVAGGVLGMRHASEVAHVHDPSSGAVVHAQELAERHEHGATHHLHGTAEHDHHAAGGACSLLAIVHATPAARSLLAIVRAPAATTIAALPASPARAAIAAYRLAPKTSPPAAA